MINYTTNLVNYWYIIESNYIPLVKDKFRNLGRIRACLSPGCFDGGGSLRWAKISLCFFVHFYQNILEKHHRIFPTARGTSEQLKNILINHIKTK